MNKNEKEIIDTMYVCGRGYMTVGLAKKVLDKSLSQTYNIVNVLIKNDYIRKYYSTSKELPRYTIYTLSKRAIEEWNILNNQNYLKRLIHRRENYEIVSDKLKMLAYYTQEKDKQLIIASFDKELLLTQRYKIPVDVLRRTHLVNTGNELFFNDVMMVDKDQNTNKLTIALFPRSKVKSETYLKDFLIKQYYLINYHLLKRGIDLAFRIVVNNEFQLAQYENTIKFIKVKKELEESNNDIGAFYEESKTPKTIGASMIVPLKKFSVSTYLLDSV